MIGVRTYCTCCTFSDVCQYVHLLNCRRAYQQHTCTLASFPKFYRRGSKAIPADVSLRHFQHLKHISPLKYKKVLGSTFSPSRPEKSHRQQTVSFGPWRLGLTPTSRTPRSPRTQNPCSIANSVTQNLKEKSLSFLLRFNETSVRAWGFLLVANRSCILMMSYTSATTFCRVLSRHLSLLPVIYVWSVFVFFALLRAEYNEHS